MRWIVDVRFRLDAASEEEATRLLASRIMQAVDMTVEFVETQRNDKPRPSWQVEGEGETP